MELHVQNYLLPEVIEFNFDELKTQIAEKAEQYANIVYTEENIKVAKADRADLNRLKKALNDERIRRQKEYMKPFDDFKAKIDEIISIIDKPVQKIDENIKYYESILQDQKKQNIEKLFENMFFPEFVNIEQIWNPKWLNATCSMNSIEAELLKQKEDIIRNCQTLAALPEHSHEAVIFYQKTLDVAGALAKVTELAEVEKAKAKMLEEENQKREIENAFNPEPKEEPDNLKQMWVQFEAYLNAGQAAALKNFFKNYNIQYRPLKMKEDN